MEGVEQNRASDVQVWAFSVDAPEQSRGVAAATWIPAFSARYHNLCGQCADALLFTGCSGTERAEGATGANRNKNRHGLGCDAHRELWALLWALFPLSAVKIDKTEDSERKRPKLHGYAEKKISTRTLFGLCGGWELKLAEVLVVDDLLRNPCLCRDRSSAYAINHEPRTQRIHVNDTAFQSANNTLMCVHGLFEYVALWVRIEG